MHVICVSKISFDVIDYDGTDIGSGAARPLITKIVLDHGDYKLYYDNSGTEAVIAVLPTSAWTIQII